MRSKVDWLHYIGQIHKRRIELGLERISAIAAELNLLEFSCPVITVAGTNGKGTTIKTLESIYLAAGYRVGTYISPHLLEFNERIAINAGAVTDAQLVAAFAVVEEARGERPLSFFEFTTLAALYLFQQADLDVLLLEVGLGGRLDAVNIVDPTMAVVTSIALDHQQWLGNDRESIGREKAGIFRKNKPAVCADPNPPQTLLQHAYQLGVPLHCLNREFTYQVHEQTWTWCGGKVSYDALPLKHLRYENLAGAIQVIELMQSQLPVSAQNITQGLSQLSLPARYEYDAASQCWFDVAHNPQATAWLAEQLQRDKPTAARTYAVVGMLGDKAVAETLSPMWSVVDEWAIVQLNTPRGSSHQQIAETCAQQGVDYQAFADVALAMQAMLKRVGRSADDRIIVFGSFYAIADAKRYLQEEQLETSH